MLEYFARCIQSNENLTVVVSSMFGNVGGDLVMTQSFATNIQSCDGHNVVGWHCNKLSGAVGNARVVLCESNGIGWGELMLQRKLSGKLHHATYKWKMR